ncbi:GntR family transcriptional regulator [Halosquirtibacter xylanolyticus]|uniref:GntR family transcriptional regulator n=1 Tax=Halosquirtibacter xylanolyticus TaxID=3374599 RepID=UPI00374A87CF|nr:GntR family transcriptional regulator [Prolixibacteraceae bacterium]
MVKEIIQIKETKGTPKYKQLIEGIVDAIQEKRLKKGDKLGSINDFCRTFGFSRDTVMLSFNDLKSRGILVSQPGKGVYVADDNVHVAHRIFVLFDELNSFKEDLYTSFVHALGAETKVDIYFHHFNREVFEQLVKSSVGKYTSYIIMSAMFNDIEDILELIPSNKVYLLDRYHLNLSLYSVIYQDFERDVYDSLVSHREAIEKYSKLVMLFPGGKEPEGRLKGFRDFCDTYGYDHEIIRSLEDRTIQKGEAYLIPSDRNLVAMVKAAEELKLKLGSDLGIISFNDTVLKEVVAGGITTISTDFKQMGVRLAEVVSNQEVVWERNPSGMILRDSL